jgi:hypothetical protein
MKVSNVGKFFLLAVLFACLANSGFSQGQQFKVGDKVEILDLTHKWVSGTVIGVLNEGGFYYRVKLDDENASTVYFNHVVPASIRARAEQNANNAGNQNVKPAIVTGGGAAAPAAGLVDVYYNATQGWNRGKIVGSNGNRVTVRFIGCDRDEIVDRSQIHSPAEVAKNAPAISFLFARWALTKVGTSSFNTAWGKADGIQINADGTYIWDQGAGKQPVRGSWVTDAKVPSTDNGTQFYDGVLVKDAQGRDWKVFKWTVKGYPDGIEAQRMCSGEAVVGSRAK